jgi:hypothetical protein
MILENRAEDIEGKEPQPMQEPLKNIVFGGVIALAVILFTAVFGPLGAASNKGVERFVNPVQVSEASKDTK